LVEYTDKFQEGAQRYDVGENSNFLLLPLLIRSLQQIKEWGVDSIYSYISTLTQYTEEKAREMNLDVLSVPNRAGHLMGIRFNKGVPQKLINNLKEESIYVSVRGNSIRIAPHLYNSKDDIEKLMSVISLS
jgi:selenocysteine lyase/cysteine desulfurase